MKAVILAAGRGLRLGAITSTQNKCMIPFQGKPIVEHIVARLADQPGIDGAVLVVGHGADAVINHFGTQYQGLPISYHVQPTQRGLVDALGCAAPAVSGERFLLMLGDEVMVEARLGEFLGAVQRYDALLGAVPGQPERLIRKTYTLLHGEDRLVHRLVEKPAVALNDLMGTGVVALPADTFELIERSPISPVRGEIDLPGLLQTMVDEGRRVGWFPICAAYTNVNCLDDLESVDSDPRFQAATPAAPAPATAGPATVLR